MSAKCVARKRASLHNIRAPGWVIEGLLPNYPLSLAGAACIERHNSAVAL